MAEDRIKPAPMRDEKRKGRFSLATETAFLN
jgi:hypothetical protein